MTKFSPTEGGVMAGTLSALSSSQQTAPTQISQTRARANSSRLAQPLSVAMVAPEIAPYAKSGGLADVLGNLPQGLEKQGVRLTLIMPAYRTVLEGGLKLTEVDKRLVVPISGRMEEGTLLKAKLGKGITVYFIRCDKYFDREYLYGSPDGDYRDNAERFIFFARAALEVLRDDPPQILHCHDWQAALAIAFLRAQPDRYPELFSTKTVMTIHNLGYQGRFEEDEWHLLDLNVKFFHHSFLEFYGQINFLKGGLLFADKITTVSPSYAKEITTAEYGFGLDGVLAERKTDLAGILNGADYRDWNPKTDPFISSRYDQRGLEGKRACKVSLQRSFGLAVRPSVPLVAITYRFVAQKGLDLLADALEDLLARNVEFIFHGSGDAYYEELFRRMHVRYPKRVGVLIGHSEPMEHGIMAGADLALFPSHYEPCGLSQMYSLRYGTIPIARATGGLKDTIVDFDPNTGRGNGFLFGPLNRSALLGAMERALASFVRKGEWATLQQNAMATRFSWAQAAQGYLNVYGSLVDAQTAVENAGGTTAPTRRRSTRNLPIPKDLPPTTALDHKPAPAPRIV